MQERSYFPEDLKDLLLALKSGSESAFETIYYMYSKRIYGNMLKMVKSADQAKELHQEVFCKVWEKRELIDPEKAFTSYLFQISKNTIYNYFRKYNLQSQVQNYMLYHQKEGYTHVEERIDVFEKEQFLKESISLLPPKRKLIFELCKMQGKSYEEVALQLGISISTVNDHIVKATKFIKERQAYIDKTLLILAMSAIFRDLN